MKNILSILLLLAVTVRISAQQAFNWQNYTDMKNVQSITSSGNGIWAATSGGAFFYNAVADSFKTLHKTDGLFGVSLSAVTVDKYGKIWFGSDDGSISVYNPADNSVHVILDIYNSNYTSKQINQLSAVGDTIFASTAFGISLIDPVHLVFYDTYFKFGSFTSNISVNSVLKSGLIYVATSSGVAIQKDNATNLSAPESWNVYSTANSLPSNTINKLAFFNGSLLAATSSGLSQFNGTSWQPFAVPYSNLNVNDILPVGDSLFILSNNTVSLYANGILSTIFSSSAPINQLTYSTSSGIVASGTNGIILIKNPSHYIFPNSPQVNQFPSLAVDNSGVLWSASGRDRTGQGFYKYDGKSWTNYNTVNTSILPNNFYHVVFAEPDNSVYFGDWGFGFLKEKNNQFEYFSPATTGMNGIQGSTTNFLVISGFATDSRNNLWVLNYGGSDQKDLAMLTPDSVWYHFSIPAANGQYFEQNFNLVIDQYDTKWFSSYYPNQSGLYFFNENKTYDNPNDDISGYLTTNDGLNSNSINSVVVDRRGDVWVGTNVGVNIITNTGGIFSGGKSSLVISSVFSLRTQTINCIAVDPINQKWIGTNQGLILVNSDGSSLLAEYDSKNSPLLSDNIISLAIDPNTGTVYVGTDAGLTSFQTSAIKPVDSYSKLFVYPSPFVLSSGGGNKLTIDGLIKDSEIKILSISGKLINDFQSPGGRVAYWDGTDSNGNLVNTGVYLIVAFDQTGNSVTTSKVAVIRK
ncbi:MAG TPA: two-component regulator propeller domain-containing protein [Ignavibacteriaceae bacterium]|nr:two-component regulator propeller domain-containing protein [Ignavibacteriaceae bacterium]